MKRLILAFFPLILFLSTPSWSQTETVPDTDDVPENIVSIRENSARIEDLNGEIQLKFDLDVKDGFFAYEDKFVLEIESFQTLQLKLDPIVSFFDKTFQKTKRGIKNKAQAVAWLSANNSSIFQTDSVILNLEYQACTPEYCLFPTTTKYKMSLSKAEQNLLKNHNQPSWLQKGLLYGLLFAFFAGFLTSLTPCVYPMLPITLAALGAQKPKTHKEGFLKGLTYALGMALTYSLLGVFAATTGFMFGSILSNVYFLGFLTLILFIAALSMYDVFEIQTPRFLQNRFYKHQNSTSLAGLFMTGVFSGLIVGPCVGPVLIGILGYVSQSQSFILGFGLLFSFAMGLGTLIIVLATFSNLIDKIPRSGTWMITVKKVMGILFLGLILYFLKPLMNIRELTVAASLIFALFGLILSFKSFSSLDYTLLEKSLYRSVFIFFTLLAIAVSSIGNERFERVFGYNMSTFAETHWETYSDEIFEQAKQQNKYIILDFYADWCAACRELKHNTFSEPGVIHYSDSIMWVYFDSTRSTAKLESLKKQYGIIGLPTILFFNPSGQIQKDLTLTGFENAENFIQRLNKLTKKPN